MTLKEQLLENTDALITAIEQIPLQQFNTKPEKGSWSAADVLEHIYRSEFGLPRLFVGETKTPNGRAPDENLETMKQRFLNLDQKMKASGVILPTEAEKSREKLVNKFRQNRKKIAQLISELPQEELCLKFEHPLLGHLTRMEWVHFSIIHTQRHLHQIERIQSQL